VRLFDPSYDHAAIARFLRRQAGKGLQRGKDPVSVRYVEDCTCGVNLPEFPKSVSLILTRDAAPGCVFGWHLSICCVTNKGYRGYAPDEGARWVNLIFGRRAHLAVEQPLKDRSRFGVEKDVRHFVVECDWSDFTDPAVNLEGLE
jgi:hypothetical protein